MKKRCGGCVNWNKVKFSDKHDGLCDFHDWRCGSGYSCFDWSPKPYDRQEQRIITRFLNSTKPDHDDYD